MAGSKETRRGVGSVRRDSPVLNRASFSDQAYAYLFQRITSGVFGEGEALPSEHELAELFGISRPVVRQALERLRQDDLIESRRGSGSFVKPHRRAVGSESFSEGRLRELLLNLEFRMVIEPASASFSAERRTAVDLDIIKAAIDDFEEHAVKGGNIGRHLDFNFHHAVATSTGNRRFVEAISVVEHDIDHAVNLARYLVQFGHLDRSRKVLREHTRIFEAIMKRDTEGARQSMLDHLEQARVRMVQVRPEAG